MLLVYVVCAYLIIVHLLCIWIVQALCYIHHTLTFVYTCVYKGLTGDVVGIEQRKQTLVFIIEFKVRRESWSGSKLRAHLIHTPTTTTTAATTTTATTAAHTVNAISNNSSSTDATLSHQPASPFPSGYDPDDYDAVCGLARGYSGWSTTHYLEPLLFSLSHSTSARIRQAEDPSFDMYRQVICLLCSTTETCEYNSDEWLMTLKTLVQKVLMLPTFVAAQGRLDTECDMIVNTSTLTPSMFPPTFDTTLLLGSTSSNPEYPSSTSSTYVKRSSSIGDMSALETWAETENFTGVAAVTSTKSASTTATSTNINQDIQSTSFTPPLPNSNTTAECATNNNTNNGVDTTTAATTPLTDKPDIHGYEWDHLKISRRKAREEALLAIDILREVIHDISAEQALQQQQQQALLAQQLALLQQQQMVGGSNPPLSYTQIENINFFENIDAYVPSVCKYISITQSENCMLDVGEWDKAWFAQFSTVESVLSASLTAAANKSNSSSSSGEGEGEAMDIVETVCVLYI